MFFRRVAVGIISMRVTVRMSIVGAILMGGKKCFYGSARDVTCVRATSATEVTEA